MGGGEGEKRAGGMEGGAAGGSWRELQMHERAHLSRRTPAPFASSSLSSQAGRRRGSFPVAAAREAARAAPEGRRAVPRRRDPLRPRRAAHVGAIPGRRAGDDGADRRDADGALLGGGGQGACWVVLLIRGLGSRVDSARPARRRPRVEGSGFKAAGRCAQVPSCLLSRSFSHLLPPVWLLSRSFSRVAAPPPPLQVVTNKWLRSFLDLECFVLSGMTAKDTLTAEMAFMFAERNSGKSQIDYPVSQPSESLPVLGGWWAFERGASWGGLRAGQWLLLLPKLPLCLPVPAVQMGGSAAVVEALVRGIQKNGGRVLLNSHVEEASCHQTQRTISSAFPHFLASMRSH